MVDRELSYLAPLEYQFLREYGNHIELQFINDEEYFDQYLSSPHRIDILIVSMELWRSSITKQGIRSVFLLSEEMPQGKTDPRGTLIYKYTSPREIFAEVNLLLRRLVGTEQSERCKIIAVFSPQGGSGKTTLSLGLLSTLSAMGARTLYLSTASIQTYGTIAQVTDWADGELIQELRQDSFSEKVLFRNIQQGKLSVLKPLRHSAAAIGVDVSKYSTLCDTARNSGKFDYVLVDMGTELSASAAQFLERADYVLLPITQTRQGRDCLEAMDRNIDLSDTEKYIPLLNGYQEKNAAPIQGSTCWEKIQETVAWEDPNHLNTLEQLKDCRIYQNLAYRFI